MLKKLITACLVSISIIAAGAGCRTHAGVTTPHHGVHVGGGIH
jgi:hypothetical protein